MSFSFVTTNQSGLKTWFAETRVTSCIIMVSNLRTRDTVAKCHQLLRDVWFTKYLMSFDVDSYGNIVAKNDRML